MSGNKTIWNIPKVVYQALSEIHESRAVALITEPTRWARVSPSLSSLPVIVQAEPERFDYAFLSYLAENVPSTVEVVYALGNVNQVTAGKVAAHLNKIPLVIIPTELDSDQIFEPHVETMTEGILSNVYTGSAEQIIVDWEVIKAAESHLRAGMTADMLAIVTGLLDWRHAVKVGKNLADQSFSPWAAGVAAGIASQTIKLASNIGKGEVEALHQLMDVTAISVQLANQLGHSRHQEGTEHYLAFAIEKQGVTSATHAECLAPGILLTSALHGQDPSALRDALTQAGIRLDALRPADIQLAVNDLPTFLAANNVPYGIGHEFDPFSDVAQKALVQAKLTAETGAWKVSSGETGAAPPVQGS